MIFCVHVGVALEYPIETHRYSRVMVEARDRFEAECIAAQMAAARADVAMPTETETQYDW